MDERAEAEIACFCPIENFGDLVLIGGLDDPARGVDEELRGERARELVFAFQQQLLELIHIANLRPLGSTSAASTGLPSR